MPEKPNTTIKDPGMGAIPGERGVTFRVWAHHAEKDYLIGTFNDWSNTSTPLNSEKNGYLVDRRVRGKTGHKYRYLIHGPKGPISRIDPYARKVTNSSDEVVAWFRIRDRRLRRTPIEPWR